LRRFQVVLLRISGPAPEGNGNLHDRLPFRLRTAIQRRNEQVIVVLVLVNRKIDKEEMHRFTTWSTLGWSCEWKFIPTIVAVIVLLIIVEHCL
jgi:hypothetical protein